MFLPPVPPSCLVFAEAPHAMDLLLPVLEDLQLSHDLAPSVGALLTQLKRQRPQLILAALRPELSYALDVVAAIREADPLSPLVVVAAFEAPAERLGLVRQGLAYDVVPPAPEGLGQLALALQRAVKHAERLTSQASLQDEAPAPMPPAPETGDAPRLTRREIEVLREIAEGRPNAEIARRLGLSAHTVRNTLHRMYHKLGADSRTHAIAVARSCRLL